MTYELLYNLEKEQYVLKAPWHISLSLVRWSLFMHKY